MPKFISPSITFFETEWTSEFGGPQTDLISNHYVNIEKVTCFSKASKYRHLFGIVICFESNSIYWHFKTEDERNMNLGQFLQGGAA